MNDTELGLVSRGNDSRLLHDKVFQRQYFAQVQRNYVDICSGSEVDTLRRTFMTVSISKSGHDSFEDGRADLNKVILGLRKLREALLATRDRSEFAKEVLLFTVRVTTLLGHYESYIPAMKRLLEEDVVELTSAERYEIGGLYVLHLAHFNNDLTAAYDAMLRHDLLDDLALRQVLRAWDDCDYVLWRRRFITEPDPGRHRMMAFGDTAIAVGSLKRIGRAYFFMQKTELETLTGWPWQDCVDQLECGWRLEDSGRVVMRERRSKVS
ncbi:hypothetical protein V1512DRAFT_259034 [Lipomyces arxii]|uniref:uncharacterized protein n=1 Tax=Lipomyces arxii TaxID=56418 RepID=UPI0034CD9362